MKILSKAQFLALHEHLVSESGGTPGLRDEGLLDSALTAPFQTFEGAELYPSVVEKAARLGYGLIANHVFQDSNKRIGTHAMLVFLALNGIELKYNDDDLIAIILDIAAGSADYPTLLEWVQAHLK